MKRSDRPTALVTGASSGIGAEFARVLAARGYDCIVTARREEKLQALAEELRKDFDVEAHVIRADLSSADGAANLHRDVKKLGKKVSFLVNNAGFGMYGNFVDQPLERIQEMLQLNITSLTTLTRLFAEEMAREKNGRILQVASIGAFQPSPLYAVYSATKAYVRDFSQALNHELRGTGVSCTTICPGLTESEFHVTADHLKPKYMDAMMMSARSVAEIGVRAAERGRTGVTPGLSNKLMQWFIAWTPRSIATWVAGLSMRARREPEPHEKKVASKPAKKSAKRPSSRTN